MSYAWCERLAKIAAGNFFHAFRLLPGRQRQAMCALYAFCRIADDLSDEPAELITKRLALDGWRDSLQAALVGEYHHPLFPALHDVVQVFSVPPNYLEAVIDGVCMDLSQSEYATFDDLHRYCWHVASAVGLCCIHIWGFRGDAKPAAEAAGVALQLTNILRDVGEDAARGRVYLPQEELRKFGVDSSILQGGPITPEFRALMEFQAKRAQDYYAQAEPLLRQLDAPGRAVFSVMLNTYRALLTRIIERRYDVFTSRVRVPKWFKIWLAIRAVPVRLGWIEK
jgi:phytoene synthase